MKSNGMMPQRQAAILSYLFDRLPIDDQVNTFDFALATGSLSKQYAAYARIADGDGELYAVFNLPEKTGDVFLGLAYGNAPEVARVFANLEDFEATNRKRLECGGFLSIGNPALSKVPGIAFLRTASADEFEKIPDCDTVQGQEIRFFLAVPLDVDELVHRQEHGHDALMEKFALESKDIVFDL